MENQEPNWNLRNLTVGIIGIIATLAVGFPDVYNFVEARMMKSTPEATQPREGFKW